MKTRVVIFLISLIICQAYTDYQQSEWQEPDAWERHSPSALTPNTCPVCDTAEESALAVFYYRKLVSNLFNKSILKQNEQTGQLQRAILFTLSPAQLAAIEQGTDIRNLDAVITAILSTARAPLKVAAEGKENGSFLYLMTDILQDIFQIVKNVLNNSDARFGLFVLLVLMLVWSIHKSLNKSLIAIVAIGLVLFGYFYTYLECNRKLEADKVLTFIKENEFQEVSWLRKAFNSVFKKSKQDEQILNIQKKSKIDLPFCRPDHVLIMYVNDIFLKQFQSIIEKCIEMIMVFKDTIPFPYNIFAMISLPFLFKSIIKMMFKHVLSPVLWYKAMSGGNTQHQQNQLQQPQVASNEDRLSGANLKVFLETITENRLKAAAQLPSSGVEEVTESTKDVVPKDKSIGSSGDDFVKGSDNVKRKSIKED